MRILVDLTKAESTGIGRYSINFFRSLYHLEATLVALVDSRNRNTDFTSERLNVDEVDVMQFEDPEELARLINRDIDVVCATNFSSLNVIHERPQVQVVHDIFPLKFPELLPSYEDLQEKIGPTKLSYLVEVALPRAIVLLDGVYDPYQHFASHQRTLVSDLFLYLFSCNVMKASKIITVSDFVRNDVLRHYNFPREIAVVYPSSPTYLGAPFRWEQKTERPASQLRVLYVAKCEPRKNFQLLLSACKGIVDTGSRRVCLTVVIGRHYSSYFNYVDNLLDRYSEIFEIHRISDVSDKKLEAEYLDADVFAFPSVEEGFGIPLLEAMYLGCPIALIDRPLNHEVCGEWGVYSENSAESFSKAILQAANSKDPRRQEINQRQVMSLSSRSAALDSQFFSLCNYSGPVA